MNKLIRKLIKYGAYRNWFDRKNDETYLKMLYEARIGKPLNLQHPVTFNEKLQWLKLNHRKQEYTALVDKCEAKIKVAEMIGNQYIIPTLGVWERFEDINFDTLPDQFVLKCTHDCGGLVICRDKSQLNFAQAKDKINKSLQTNYYYSGREWPYKHVKPRIIAEQYMYEGTDASSKKALLDYKFFCFNGRVDSVMVCTERETGSPKFYFFDEKWNLKRYNKRGKEAPKNFTLPKPDGMDQMFELASRLSEGIPYVRVDLYNINGAIYFGEMTFYPESGFDENILPESDEYWGDMIVLPAKKEK